ADGIDEAGRREASAGRGPRDEPGHGVDASDLDRSVGRLMDEGATTRSLSLSGLGRPGRRYRQRVTHEPGRADRRRNGRTAPDRRAVDDAQDVEPDGRLPGIPAGGAPNRRSPYHRTP